MADLKKKFIDILFEDDPEDQNLIDGSYETNNYKGSVDSPIKAKDVLYKKSSSSAFINLDEKIDKDEFKIEDITKEEYELSSQLSPIFGLIKENKKKDINVSKDLIDSQTNRPSDSHLDIITSPIYGYASKENVEIESKEIHDEKYDDLDNDINNDYDEDDTLNNEFDILDSNEDNEEDLSNFKLFGDDK